MKMTMWADGSGNGIICVVIKYEGVNIVPFVQHDPGDLTHNQSEWHSLCYALELLTDDDRNFGGNDVTIYMDSELVVRQFNGEYQVKDPVLGMWIGMTRELCKRYIGKITVEHIPRRDNVAGMLMDKIQNTLKGLQWMVRNE